MEMYDMNFILQHMAELCMIPHNDMLLFKNFDLELKSVGQNLAGAEVWAKLCQGRIMLRLIFAWG